MYCVTRDEGIEHAPPISGSGIEGCHTTDGELAIAKRDPALAILTSQTNWVIANNKESISKAKREAIAAGRDYALVRDVRGITGDQKPFAERKIQFLTSQEANTVRDFLSANLDFAEALLKDPSALLGEYPHTKPIDGSFSGWLAQKIEFSVVSIAGHKDGAQTNQ